MNELAVIDELVAEVMGKHEYTSLDVAKRFNKRHDNVLRDIKRIRRDCSDKFWRLNFEESSRTIKTGNGTVREFPMYRMTRDGFTVLVMGFTGKEAARWKELYIRAFNKMEEELKKRLLQNNTISFAEALAVAVNKLKIEESSEHLQSIGEQIN